MDVGHPSPIPFPKGPSLQGSPGTTARSLGLLASLGPEPCPRRPLYLDGRTGVCLVTLPVRNPGSSHTLEGLASSGSPKRHGHKPGWRFSRISHHGPQEECCGRRSCHLTAAFLLTTAEGLTPPSPWSAPAPKTPLGTQQNHVCKGSSKGAPNLRLDRRQAPPPGPPAAPAAPPRLQGQVSGREGPTWNSPGPRQALC